MSCEHTKKKSTHWKTRMFYYIQTHNTHGNGTHTYIGEKVYYRENWHSFSCVKWNFNKIIFFLFFFYFCVVCIFSIFSFLFIQKKKRKKNIQRIFYILVTYIIFRNLDMGIKDIGKWKIKRNESRGFVLSGVVCSLDLYVKLKFGFIIKYILYRICWMIVYSKG